MKCRLSSDCNNEFSFLKCGFGRSGSLAIPCEFKVQLGSLYKEVSLHPDGDAPNLQINMESTASNNINVVTSNIN